MLSRSGRSQNHEGGPGQRQDMQPPAHADARPGSSLRQGLSQQRPQAMDSRLLIAISAVQSFNDFPEEFVRSCATDMKNSGKLVNSVTLLEECESRHLAEGSQLENYLEGASCGNNASWNNALSSSAETSLVSTHNSEQHLQHALLDSSLPSPTHHKPEYSSLPSSTHHTPEYSSLPPTHSSYNYTSNRRPGNGWEHYTSQSNVLHGADEDCVDGHLTSDVSDDGLNGWPQSHAAAVDGVTVLDSQTESQITTSPPAISGHWNMLLLESSASSSTHWPSYTQTAPGILKVSTDRNVSKEAGTENSAGVQEQECQVAETARLSPADEVEHLKTCFRLVEREHVLLEKSRLCNLCLLRPRDVTFLPCGHFAACRSCAEPIYVCPCCNKSILATVDTYLC